ncbi:hypothetical protein L7F22_053601 [Adiantum nelumboides]|nr:hypothetical protein [Adiantum nelumboides]
MLLKATLLLIENLSICSMAPINRKQVNVAKPMIAKNSIGEGTLRTPLSSLTVSAVGSKDRHSKVRTAKGLRDRRVRLSAPTAVQFFEVQDRLGFDQPSKALDWLIRNARTAIDELAPLQPVVVNSEADSMATESLSQEANTSPDVDEQRETASAKVEQQKSSESHGGSRASARSRERESTKEKTKSDEVSPALSATSASSFITVCGSKQLSTQQLPFANYHSIQQAFNSVSLPQPRIPHSVHVPTYSFYTASEPNEPRIFQDIPQQLAYFSIPGADHQASTSYCSMPISPGGTLQSIFNDVFTDFSHAQLQSVPIMELYPLMGLHDNAAPSFCIATNPQASRTDT